MNAKELHDRVLYPVVRVRQEKAGGSGVIIYSAPDPKHSDKYISMALTCAHVVADAIEVKEEWDAVLKRDVKKDVMKEVAVEVFDYEGSQILSSNSTPATIVAYDKSHDLAVLRLHNPRHMPYVSRIIPESEIEGLRVFSPIWISGCSLLHDPFASPGTLTYLREMIDEKTYLMCNAPAVFGNSGGGLFSDASGDLLGITARLSAIQLGFGVDLLTWMNFSVHPLRIYEFLRHQELHFLFDSNDNYYDAMERREQKRKEGLRALLAEKGR